MLVLILLIGAVGVWRGLVKGSKDVEGPRVDDGGALGKLWGRAFLQLGCYDVLHTEVHLLWSLIWRRAPLENQRCRVFFPPGGCAWTICGRNHWILKGLSIVVRIWGLVAAPAFSKMHIRFSSIVFKLSVDKGCVSASLDVEELAWAQQIHVVWKHVQTGSWSPSSRA